MQRGVVAVLIALVIYSGLLIAFEARHGTEAARAYLDDPPEPVLFGHVNTSLSAALLAATALVFAIGLRLDATRGRRFFPASQAAVFLFLAADERFRLLPALAREIALPELAGYALIAGLELALLLGPGRLAGLGRQGLPVVGAGALFALSLLLDVAGHRWLLHGSAEELPKVWAGALLLGFAWRRMEASWPLAAPTPAARRPSLVARAAALAAQRGELAEAVAEESRAVAALAPDASPAPAPEAPREAESRPVAPAAAAPPDPETAPEAVGAGTPEGPKERGAHSESGRP